MSNSIEKSLNYLFFFKIIVYIFRKFVDKFKKNSVEIFVQNIPKTNYSISSGRSRAKYFFLKYNKNINLVIT